MNEISVIIPAFNRARLLPLTLRSILAQSVPAKEILVVDDGSTDGTSEAAEAFGSAVRVIRQNNGGPASARNTGWRESTGEFLHFFDSDDVALPNKHEVQLRTLNQSNADIAYGPWVKGSISNHGFQAADAILQQHGLPVNGLVKALLTNWSIVPHACLFRRSIIDRAGGFPEHLFGTEDQLMFLKCLLAGAKVVHSAGTLVLYRNDNAGKITDASGGRAKQVCEWARFLVEAAQLCKEAGIDARVWFGFRRRVWEAFADMRRYEVDRPEVSMELSKLLEGSTPRILYKVERSFQRMRIGVLARLGRGRAHPCFRAGRINLQQARAYHEWERA